MIAALFVDASGCYAGLDGVDLWDLARDARNYRGPHAVVAHPPCKRWCQIARIVQARFGHSIGDDDGCFASALDAVRRYGGVLEHPAYSYAWPAFDLPRPPIAGGWQRGFCGGWAAHVEQAHYGHPARKATWLYCFGAEPPPMVWGPAPASETHVVSWLNPAGRNGRRVLTKREAAATPPAFRDILLRIARSARVASPA